MDFPFCKPTWERILAQVESSYPPWSASLGPMAPCPMVSPSGLSLLEPSKTFQNIPDYSGTFRNNSRTFQYMNLILRTIPDLLVMSWIPSETPNNLRSPSHILVSTLKTSTTLKCVTLRFENNADMTETPHRSMINSGTWRSMMTPTCSTNNIDRLNHKHRT